MRGRCWKTKHFRLEREREQKQLDKMICMERREKKTTFGNCIWFIMDCVIFFSRWFLTGVLILQGHISQGIQNVRFILFYNTHKAVCNKTGKSVLGNILKKQNVHIIQSMEFVLYLF